MLCILTLVCAALVSCTNAIFFSRSANVSVEFNSPTTPDLHAIVNFPGVLKLLSKRGKVFVSALDILEIAGTDNDLSDFCLDLDIEIRDAVIDYGLYLRCISGECESDTNSSYWFVYLNGEVANLEQGIDKIEISNGDLVSFRLEEYLTGCPQTGDLTFGSRNGVPLPDTQTVDDLLGFYYLASLSNLFFEQFLSTTLCLSYDLSLEVPGVYENITALFGVSIAPGVGFSFSQLYDQQTPNTAEYLARQFGASEFPLNFLFVSDDVVAVFGCNESSPGAPAGPGIWENIQIYSRTKTLTNEQLTEVFDALFELGVPLVQIQMIDFGTDACPLAPV